MWRERLRTWLPLWAMVTVALMTGGVLYLLFRAHSRIDLSTYGAFAWPVAVTVAAGLGWAWRKSIASPTAATASRDALDHVADLLAAAVQKQWENEAVQRRLTGTNPIQINWSRPSQAIAGPAAAATKSNRFAPLPGLAETGEAELAFGSADDLHALYGGLRSGRLIIAGPPGSGKTGAAILLVLGALRHREEISPEQRPRVPVPVLITAQDWDPAHELAVLWLERKLRDTYALLFGVSGAPAALLASGRITVVIDGLDEIDPELQPTALQALSQQATFRLVILSRSSEIASAAASQGVLQGAAAIELNPVAPASAADYLKRVQLDPPPAGWQELITRVRTRPDSPLSQALTSPLSLTLVRDTYGTDDIWELLEFSDVIPADLPAALAVEAISDHLLDRVLAVAYDKHFARRSLPYDLATAQQTLEVIAAYMNRAGTRDLNWWQIHAWENSAPRVLAGAVGIGVLFGLSSLLGGWLQTGVGAGIMLGSMMGLGFSPDVRRISDHRFGPPARPHGIGDLRITRALIRNLTPGLTVGLGLGLTFGLVFGLTSGFALGLKVGLTVGLGLGLATALMVVVKADSGSLGALNPRTSWVGSRNYGRVLQLIFGLVVGLMCWLARGLEAGLGGGLAAGLAFGLVSETYTASLAFVQLAIRQRTPLRLMRFLRDAYSRDVLRAVGPSYQFRHARLQDRLAAWAAASDTADQAGLAPRIGITAGEADEATLHE